MVCPILAFGFDPGMIRGFQDIFDRLFLFGGPALHCIKLLVLGVSIRSSDVNSSPDDIDSPPRLYLRARGLPHLTGRCSRQHGLSLRPDMRKPQLIIGHSSSPHCLRKHEDSWLVASYSWLPDYHTILCNMLLHISCRSRLRVGRIHPT